MSNFKTLLECMRVMKNSSNVKMNESSVMTEASMSRSEMLEDIDKAAIDDMYTLEELLSDPRHRSVELLELRDYYGEDGASQVSAVRRKGKGAKLFSRIMDELISRLKSGEDTEVGRDVHLRIYKLDSVEVVFCKGYLDKDTYITFYTRDLSKIKEILDSSSGSGESDKSSSSRKIEFNPSYKIDYYSGSNAHVIVTVTNSDKASNAIYIKPASNGKFMIIDKQGDISTSDPARVIGSDSYYYWLAPSGSIVPDNSKKIAKLRSDLAPYLDKLLKELET